MTQTTHKTQRTHLMQWYVDSEKMNAITSIRFSLKEFKLDASMTLIVNWCKGYSEPKKEGQLAALEAVTGIDRTKLFELIK